MHESLPYRVPPLCEHCCCPIEVTAYGSVFVSHTWPGTFGLPVFFHAAPCAKQAVAALRKSRRPEPDPD